MSKKRLIPLVGGTVVSALAIGFFMQRGESSSPRNLLPLVSAPVQQAILKPVDPVTQASLSAVDLTGAPAQDTAPYRPSRAPAMIKPSAPDATPAGRSAIKDIGETGDQAALPTDPEMPKLGCDVTASAEVAALAMVTLSVSAPCFTNERATIHHSGLMFTDVTDDKGQINVSVPALSDRAVFIVSFGNGNGSVALANVPSLAQFDRVAVQWSGNAGFQIHAREFGAAYGEAGHVWSGMPHTGDSAGGFVTVLGDSDTLVPQMAEIYTFPSNNAAKSGVVALSVEAEVTQNNCGRDISAQSLELRDRYPLRTRDLVLAMPDCAALGDFLVLNNLVDDLKIAAR